MTSASIARSISLREKTTGSETRQQKRHSILLLITPSWSYIGGNHISKIKTTSISNCSAYIPGSLLQVALAGMRLSRLDYPGRKHARADIEREQERQIQAGMNDPQVAVRIPCEHQDDKERTSAYFSLIY
jgi:hypothetical protein